MRKLQINVLEKDDYGFTLKGSKALKLLMDQSTPPIDLLVRESVQNSSDAVLRNKSCAKIYFNTGEFPSHNLADILDVVGERMLKKYGNGYFKYLEIRDSNTCGLLGSPNDEIGPNNNLFKLVYSFLESGKDDNAGGSWGIGKSVYYRFGKGIVFYYSRTYENNKFCEKLCGAIIEDETSLDSLLNFNNSSCGIAFFGKNVDGKRGNERSIPVYDHSFITDFLKIFNLEPFSEDQTGTSIIIPFFNEDDCIKKCNNLQSKPWDGNFEESLKIALQRWYFPKINNKSLNLSKTQYLNLFINHQHIELNPFFKTLQSLYLKKLEGCEINEITSNQPFSGKLGDFVFKKFTDEELDVRTMPNNLPDPYVFLDLKNDESEKNDAIIFYTRKPGMIITYDDSNRFTNLQTDKGTYLIGLFILNDNAYFDTCPNDTLGLYFKECEAANHKRWEDISSSTKIKRITSLKNKPFKKIQIGIKKVLRERFEEEEIKETLTSNSALQRRLGEMLLPPEGFGKDREASIVHRPKKKEEDKLVNLKKVNTKTFFNGYINGCPSYTIQALLKPKNQFICRLIANTSSKKYYFDEWDSMDFVLPCYIKEFSIPEYTLGKMNYKFNYSIDLSNQSDEINFVKNNGISQPVFKIISKRTSNSKKTYEIKIQNYYEAELRITFNILLEPIDDTVGFTFLRNVSSFNGGDSQ